MAQERLERCANGCCHFVDGKPVTKEEYDQAIVRHPGHSPGIKPGQSNAILETIIACRNPKFTMTFTAVRNAATNEMTGVEIMAQRGNETLTGGLLSPGAFYELMLSSRIFDADKLDRLFRAVSQQGQVSEENVRLDDQRIRHLELHPVRAAII